VAHDSRCCSGWAITGRSREGESGKGPAVPSLDRCEETCFCRPTHCSMMILDEGSDAREIVAQGQFKIYWQPGATNLADYFMKHHPPAHHANMRAEVLTRVQDLAEIRLMKNESQTKSPDKIATLQGCVRQASLRELVQRILAREKFKFSPRSFAKQATIELDHK
jgi:hypothetical protein